MSDETLESLGVKLVDQDQLETSITKKANETLITKDTELDQKRLEKAEKDLNKTVLRIRALNSKLHHPRTKISQRKSIKDEIEWYEENELKQRQEDVNDITKRLEENKAQLNESRNSTSKVGDKPDTSAERLPDETEKDFLIRTGKITAFGNENLFYQDDKEEGKDDEVKSHVYLRAPGFENTPEVVDFTAVDDEDLEENEAGKVEEDLVSSDDDAPTVKRRKLSGDDDFVDDDSADDDVKDEIIDEEAIDESDDELDEKSEQRNIDDGNETLYQARLKDWVKRRSKLRKNESAEEKNKEEWFKPHPTISDAKLNDQFRLPGDIYPSLFDYQKTCVQWLWELYSQKTGGIIGDEMGLGKTIQIISFVAGLHYSGLLTKPILVVVPATVLNQWVNEFHRWWPPLRCVILHSIGSGMGKTDASEERLEQFLETSDPSMSRKSLKGINTEINAKDIIDRVMEKGHVLVTTYVGLRIYSKHILRRQWGYCILDEGHKIRNPDSDISLTCKQIKTHNRIILSGTPIQNNLIELWSLFDFVFPGRLGTLPVFQQQFSIPINMGGYANASNVQVQTGYKCAVILRDLISPYLLRRLKSDVAKDLPKKNEMVLFVRLTKDQQDLYEKFLGSEELGAILKGKRNVLLGVDILRKICNHPDLVNRDILRYKKGYNYGNPVKSGKMQVLQNLLQLWQSQDHKTLLFCQTRQMLDILEKFVANLPKLDVETQGEGDSFFSYLRMDGSTPIAKRQALVDQFNEDPKLSVFLLTTKVGGLGVNLTGADRVIIFDPDWNPSTDMQARERAWRLGQKKDITIYRLMTSGSIEEKIYHRQIFKTFLTNKILKDPKQRRFFKVNDLHDLFTLGDQNEVGTETGDMFNSSEQNFGGNKNRKSTHLMKKKHSNDDDFYQVASIAGVSKLDEFEADEDDNDSKTKTNDDSRIMENIFSNSGVHSTLQHEEVINSGNQELTLVEKEANRVANAAAQALKQSRKQARTNVVGTPTWTGKFGLAGKFGPKRTTIAVQSPHNGNRPSNLSSSSILGKLKKERVTLFGNKSKTGTTTNSNAESEVVDKVLESKKEIIKKLVAYLNDQKDNFSSSGNILKNVNIEMKDSGDMVEIRSMLREIANWDGVNKGWILKNEFKT
ncbi:DNA dependent ATPase [Scheffersomyces coipomensis]|uniref:DNA dependent ATPase n=1 Tax=Scheffersomyces coipomensis TaxID=1788519 RepID=UPI00315DF283